MKRALIILIAILATTASLLAQTQTTSTHLRFKNGLSTDSIRTFTGDSMIIDGGGLLKFRDGASGEYELADLIGGGGTTYWQRSGTTLSPLTAGDDILLAASTEQLQLGNSSNYLYSPSVNNWTFVQNSTTALTLGSNFVTYRNFTPGATSTYDIGSSSLFFNNGHFDHLYIEDANTYIDLSGSDLRFTDANAGTKTLTELIPWTKSGTNISPTTAGDDILLGTNEAIRFGVDGNTFLYESAANVLSFYLDGAMGLRLYSTASGNPNMSYNHFNPSVNHTYNLGGTTRFWANSFIDTIYVGDLNTYINLVGSDMSLTSVDAGTVDLNDLPQITGTPANNDIAIWNSFGILEGDPNLTWTGSAFRAQGTGRFDNYLSVYTTVESPFRMYQTDVGGTPGTPEAGSNYISFYDNDGDSQGYVGIGASGNLRLAPQISGGYIYALGDLRTTGDITIGTGNYLNLVSGGSSYIRDNSGVLTFGDGTTGTKTLAELAASGSASDSSWTSITVDTISELGTAGIDFMADGGVRMTVESAGIHFYEPILPLAAGLDIGRSSDFFRSIYADTWYVEDATTLIEKDVSNNLSFTDAVSGTHTLADLLSGGVSASGTPVNNQLAIWTDASTIEGDGDVTWDNTTFSVNGQMSIPWNSNFYFDGAGGSSYIRGWGVSGVQMISGSSINMVWTGSSVQLGSGIPIIGWSDKGNNLGSTSLFWDNAYFDDVFIDDASTTIGKDASNNMTFTDAVTGPKTLAELAAAGGGGYWSRQSSSTPYYVYPTTSGDGIFLPTDDRMMFRYSNTYWSGDASTTHMIRGFVAGVNKFSIRSGGVYVENGDLISGNSTSNNIGTTSTFWGNSYIDRMYVGNTSTDIDLDGSSNMSFTDANAGTVTLSELDDIPIYQTISTETGSTYTLDIDDAQTLIISDVNGGSAISVPPNSIVAFPVGTRIRISKIGTGGNCNIYEGSGVTVNHWETSPAVRSMGTGELIKIDTDEWMLTGDIVQDA